MLFDYIIALRIRVEASNYGLRVLLGREPRTSAIIRFNNAHTKENVTTTRRANNRRKTLVS